VYPAGRECKLVYPAGRECKLVYPAGRECKLVYPAGRECKLVYPAGRECKLVYPAGRRAPVGQSAVAPVIVVRWYCSVYAVQCYSYAVLPRCSSSVGVAVV